ncbi:isochorismate synthase [Nonlabens ponticola]|uniref:isochorismate synthase n=1 Tax=Nonlabens ponticola TaxID=2496866 RepID=A0A3S9MZH3_9FLAO|nr:isochorismate synthase [Nonlabens ponticola]AZQ44655.1 isochorismate synthase [Nonlabens ponticola]
MRENLLSYTQELLEQDLPFLLLRQQGEPRVKILSQNDKKLHKTATDTMSYAVFSKFQNTENQIIIRGDVIQEFRWSLSGVIDTSTTVKLDVEDKHSHIKLVNRAVQHIQNSELQKVVLSRKVTVQQESSIMDILSRLLDNYPDANCYLFHHPAVGTWLGATPEILLSYKDGMVKTMSLAGTMSAQNKEAVQWTIKEQEEQELVTRFISSQLSKVTDQIETSKVETIKAGELYHLKTDITARVRNEDLDKCLALLHPTPAVCGVPRDLALDFIRDHENYDRSFYTGYLGIVQPKGQEAKYFVNLRCMKIEANQISLYAGGGITAMSDPIAEYQETENKLRIMSRLL